MSAKGGTYQHLMMAELKILLNSHWTLIVLTVYVLFYLRRLFFVKL